MLNRSEQFTSYENDIRFTSDENDMISGNARQIKEFKTDLSPEGSPSSGSIDSNIKGKRKFMLFFLQKPYPTMPCVEQEVQWPARGPKALQKIKTKEYKACLQKNQS